MDSSGKKLLFKNEVYQIVACAIEVLNTLGHGIVEKPYENALVVEFRIRQIPFRQPRRLSGSSTQKSSTESQTTWTDIELFADHEFASGPNSKFQTPETGVGTHRLVNSCSFVSIRGFA